MNVELLRELTEAHGVSGREGAVREIARRELESLGELSVDPMGNLICRKPATRGPKKGAAKRLMIAAHLDEIGFVVRFVDGNGFVRLQPVGGWDPRQMFSQRVIVHTEIAPLRGVLAYGTKPKHLLTDEEMKQGPKIENFFVDLGLNEDEAKARVRIGDPVTMDRGFAEVGNLLACKAMDDRVGVFVMIEALRAVRDHSVDVVAVATVQEEVGLRGASASGWSIVPDAVVALDITLANDIPGVPDEDHVTRLGEGAAIKVMDSSLICHPGMVDHFRALAEEHGIPFQMEVLPRGGTDAGGVQRLHGGIPAFTLSIPTRYVHTVNETVHPTDVRACIDVLARYIADAHKGDYLKTP